ncbi:neuraminidase-like domain-containing protein [Pseudomonas sp. H3(2019)]|uniref:Tc toxin subunit A-related protein n=1 Tax=Pseudomonas sp. H3(2019) TaxID=2598724 RepID=UPI0011959624|nr:neuraminidase-like domain-containing protein [Pseudomonas sp. H3(2019)]TVT84560.1 toxin [Pseudomonas sp. H3(2019)]
MTVAIKKQLDESLRDALLALYLDKVVPADATTKTLKLKTVQDLYEYWLLDVLVSQDVPTTPVACAIASLQHYINRILMNMETGYDSATITPERVQTWRNELHQYPIWAAHQKLLYFPAMYLDPSLRNNKSDNFRQLENELNQNRIQPDAVQSAVLSYLTRFEEVANLNILNGYIDGEDFANSTYYFIAKSRSEHTYFWRSLNMAQRPLTETQAAGANSTKQDQPDPYAWSDWKKADVPIPDDAIEHTIRPVWFNNRLFVIWAQCIHTDPANASGDATTIKSNPQLLVSYCYKKTNDTWSAPQTRLKCFIENGSLGNQAPRSLDEAPLYTLHPDLIKSRIGTVAVQHQEDAQDVLLIAIALFPEQRELLLLRDGYSPIIYGSGNESSQRYNFSPIFLNTASIDKNFKYTPGKPSAEFNVKEPLKLTLYKLTYSIFKHPINESPHPVTYLQSTSVKNESESRFKTPKISCKDAVQFLDFSDSTISLSDNGKDNRQLIRLNTSLATEMTHRAENSLDELFSRETQLLPEPKISSTDPDKTMDFHGPNGRYFTELFLDLPWLIAHRLNAEQQYDEAERWIGYLFDPGRQQSELWKAVPLTGAGVTSYSDRAPHDPHQIALSHPVHFRKALYFLYLDILINRGDAAYRALTPDSLGEAKLWYVRALDLLGPRPVVQQVDQWSSVSLQTLSETPSENLRTFESALSRLSTTGPLQIREGNPQTSLPPIDTPHLHLPFNPELLKRWDIAESRLYNLRHNLDITGKPLHLPLFAAPLDPRGLLAANASSASSGVASSLPTSQIPHYRFTVMHSLALSAVESVSQFGATLLSLIERKEQAQLQELQQQQAWDLAKISVDLQTQALRIDRQNRQALLASKAIVQGRVSHYQQLLEKDVSETETLAGQLYLSSGAFEVAASASQVVAGGLMVAPNIFGLSNGGMRWEGAAHAATALAQGKAIVDRTMASSLDRTAQFNRRREEWTLTRDQAHLELAQIDAQLAHFTEQETATRLQLRLAETTLSQTKANYDFLGKRFTKMQLYQWLNSQFAALYYQAYDATLALCLAAEACWQYERADFTTRLVQPGAWNTTYRGLGAGEQLKLSLLKMQAEYMQRNERELEIRKTVSLRQLKAKDSSGSINKEWKDIQIDLKNGACDFELTHKMFEDDYKDQNHYLRRIKTISVSLPAVLGPYENVRATLTQTSSKVFMSAGSSGSSRENLRASQQIALSTGLDDNGLFTLNFNDERYLPFEYTGAISTWRLTFPNPEAQQVMLESLTDIIVHVSYTARAGGGSQ